MRNRKSQAHAIHLRKTTTDAERHLWRRLRQKQIEGFRFRRQYSIGPFIADFACLEARLIVEVDGGQHNRDEQRDERRTQALAKRSFHVLRFWNDAVLQETDAVMEAIAEALRKRPHPDSPP